MALYCKAGQTARVTLVPAKVLEFPGPVDVEKLPDINTGCFWVTVKYAIDVSVGTSSQRSSNGENGAYTPIGGLRISPTNALMVQIFARLDSCTEPIQWRNWVPFSAFSGRIANPRIIEIVNPPQRGIIIKDSKGVILYQDSTTRSHSVECLGCPPNSLDCADCCLNCTQTFNEISGLRKLLSQK